MHFIDHFGRVDEKLHKKVLQQKSMEHKLILGQKALK